MRFRELFAELMWLRTQKEFADLLGISQRMVSVLLTGERNPGYQTIRGLVKAFPEREQEIWAAFRDREKEEI